MTWSVRTWFEQLKMTQNLSQFGHQLFLRSMNLFQGQEKMKFGSFKKMVPNSNWKPGLGSIRSIPFTAQFLDSVFIAQMLIILRHLPPGSHEKFLDLSQKVVTWLVRIKSLVNQGINNPDSREDRLVRLPKCPNIMTFFSSRVSTKYKVKWKHYILSVLHSVLYSTHGRNT